MVPFSAAELVERCVPASLSSTDKEVAPRAAEGAFPLSFTGFYGRAAPAHAAYCVLPTLPQEVTPRKGAVRALGAETSFRPHR